jgi:ParB family transcriptional regulator, chromosome partitioning protein
MPPKNKTPMSGKIRSDMFGTSADLMRVIEIDLDKISPNPEQPRKFFDEIALNELADSIEKNGLLQPILVKKINSADHASETYFIVAGERRYRAHKQIGKATIAAVITAGDTDEVALIENIQREQLRPLETAEALDRLMATHGYTQDAVGKVIGKARNTVSELLSLLKLPESIKADVRTSDTASKSMLIELVKLEQDAQLAAWQAFKEGKTVTVKAVRQTKQGVENSEATVVVKKPKKVFHTQQKASVIVQSDDEKLTDKQVIAALREALAQIEVKIEK